MSSGLLAAIVFVITYGLIVAIYDWRTVTVWAAVVVLFVFRVIDLRGAIAAIDWNVVLLYFGMLFVSEAFLYSRMPDYLATHVVGRTGKVGAAMLLLCILTGLLSVALENVAVVLLMAPVALSISRSCNISPGPLFVGMAVSSNLQGAATLIGDPPSMLLAGFTGMSFNDFFVVNGKPSIFFAVQVGAIVSAFVLALAFRGERRPMPAIEPVHIRSKTPAFIILALVLSLVVTSTFFHSTHIATGLVCAIYGAISAAWYVFHVHRSEEGNGADKRKNLSRTLFNLDWQTGLFLIGVFVLVSSLTSTGLMSLIADLILSISGSNAFAIFLLVVGISVLVSAFVDNVPFLVAMLPVLKTLTASSEADPNLFYFGLLIGASVGGNITPIGASGNIVAMGIVKREGYSVRFFDFVKIGLPFTLVAVMASAAFLWVVFT